MEKSDLPADLVKAYRSAHYTAVTPSGELLVTIGMCCELLDSLCEMCDVSDWAYLTACNPGSMQHSLEKNQKSNSELFVELELRAQVVFPGMALSSSDDWPPEASFLALGLAPDSAEELGRKFGQNAIVIGERGGVAELVFLNSNT